ncbi:uncharacterized protein LOC114537123 [Dendronephthya gigantea]|uniref:uncharacterized protein LOC114537123 n=1 Tax=Dendronephthya gigantea TaxID=151771 RepID=UPI00106B63DF|nr:uncharacterized protein LOC114537123 [Dendronephthya gigantea]
MMENPVSLLWNGGLDFGEPPKLCNLTHRLTTPSPPVNKKIFEAFSNDPVEETGETNPLAKYFSTRRNTSSTSKEAATPTPSPSVNKKILEAFSNDPVEATGVTNPLAKYFSTPAPEVKTTVKVEKFVEVKAPTSTLPPDEYVVEQVVENLDQSAIEVGPTSPTSTPPPDENILRSVAKDLVQAAIETSKEELISEQISRFDSSASQVKKFVEVQALLLKTSTSTVPPDEYILRAVAKDLVQATIKASQVDLFSEVTLLDSSSSDQPCKNKMSNNQHSSAHEFFDSFGSSDSGTAPFHRVDHSFFTPNKNQTSFPALPPTSNAAEQRFVSPATNAQNFEPANLSAYAHPRQNVGDHAMSMQEPSYGAQERYSTAQLFSEAGASTTKETPHAKQLSDAENHATLTPPSYGSNLPEQPSAHTGNDLFNVAKSSTPGGGTSQLFSGQHQNDPFKAGAWTSTEDLAENQSAAQNSIPTSSSYAPMAGYPGETQSAQRKLASSLTSDNAVNSEASQPGFSINNEENNHVLRSDVVQPDTPQLGPSSMVPFTSKEQLPSNHQTAWQPATQPFDSQASSDDVKAEPTQWDAIDPHGTPRNTQQASTLQQTSGPVYVGEKSSGIFYTHPSSNDQSAQFGNHGAGTIGSANLESSLPNLETMTARDDESRDGNSLSGHQEVPAFGHERVNSLNTSDPKLDTPPANTSTIISNDDLTSGNQQALSSQHLGASVTMFPVGMTPQNTNKASIASTETRGSQQLDTVDPNQHPSAFMPVKPNFPSSQDYEERVRESWKSVCSSFQP